MSLLPHIAALLSRELNSEQQEAALSGPEQTLRIIAGPGTGKTKTLAYRFLALTAGRNVPTHRVLALTFTEKAALEMQERVKALLPPDAKPQISTFHGFAARLLHESARQNETEVAGAILDELDKQLLQTQLYAEILNEPGLARRYPHLDFGDSHLAPAVFAAIESLRDAYQSPEDLLISIPANPAGVAEVFRVDAMRFTAQVYAAYRARLLEKKKLDFPELIYRAYFALKENQILRDYYQQRFVHILVDEFQDTSLSQLEFLRLLSPKLDNITIVGDRKQSIYGWRNARPENFEDAALLQSRALALTRNYRSYQPILDIAATALLPLIGEGGKVGAEELALLAHQVLPENSPCVTLARSADAVPKEDGEAAEARFIAAEIAKIRQQPGGDQKSIAILLRSVRSGSQSYEDALREADIQYITIGGGGFYDQQEVLYLIAVLRLLCNSRDGQAFYRLATAPRFRLSQRLLQRLAELARKDESYQPDQDPIFEKGAELYLQTIAPSRETEKLQELIDMLNEGRAEMKTRSCSDLVLWAIENKSEAGSIKSEESNKYQVTSNNSELTRNSQLATRNSVPSNNSISPDNLSNNQQLTINNSIQAEANCRKLHAMAEAFEQAEPGAGLPELAQYFTLWLESDLPEQEAALEPEEGPPANVVQIMTVHQSKGLEFDVVFVARQKPFRFSLNRPGQPVPLFVYQPNREALFKGGFALLNYYDTVEAEIKRGMDYEVYKELEKARSLEEERFVLYVALTRARERLYITSPLSQAVEQIRPPKTFFFRELIEGQEVRYFSAEDAF